MNTVFVIFSLISIVILWCNINIIKYCIKTIKWLEQYVIHCFEKTIDEKSPFGKKEKDGFYKSLQYLKEKDIPKLKRLKYKCIITKSWVIFAACFNLIFLLLYPMFDNVTISYIIASCVNAFVILKYILLFNYFKEIKIIGVMYANTIQIIHLTLLTHQLDDMIPNKERINDNN